MTPQIVVIQDSFWWSLYFSTDVNCSSIAIESEADAWNWQSIFLQQSFNASFYAILSSRSNELALQLWEELKHKCGLASFWKHLNFNFHSSALWENENLEPIYKLKCFAQNGKPIGTAFTTNSSAHQKLLSFGDSNSQFGMMGKEDCSFPDVCPSSPNHRLPLCH